MKAEITRTSTFLDDVSPHWSATEFFYWEKRNEKKQKDFDFKKRIKESPSEFRYISEDKDSITYERKVKVWLKEFNTLQDLLNFKNEVKTPVIISNSQMQGIDFTIEIYDDYRE